MVTKSRVAKLPSGSSARHCRATGSHFDSTLLGTKKVRRAQGKSNHRGQLSDELPNRSRLPSRGLAGKGFTQAPPVHCIGFSRDVTEQWHRQRPLPRRTLVGLYQLGQPDTFEQGHLQPPEARTTGSTRQGCEGHGNPQLPHIGGTMTRHDRVSAHRHRGISLGLCVCPFVKIGSSVSSSIQAVTNRISESSITRLTTTAHA